MGDIDNAYKQLFSHPEMVRDLLRGFVQEAWVKQLDFSTLEKVGGSYATDDIRDREDDILWRVRWGKEWLYVYIILEFQATIDFFMSLRNMVYAGLLYQDLIKSKTIKGNQKLPPIFPVVLYNGLKRWDAAKDVADLILTVPGGLEQYRPQMRYLLLDIGSYTNDTLAPLHNLAAALFRLENSRTQQDFRIVLKELIEWLKAPEQTSLRRAFTVWMRRVLLPKRLSVKEIPNLSELHEVNAMLETEEINWAREWHKEARQEAQQEGRLEGLQEGLQKGLQKGLQEGLQKGRRKEGASSMLSRLLQKRFQDVPDWAHKKIAKADLPTLEAWGLRVLDAKSLGDVFGA